MADLTFYYGTMASSKTANALMKKFQYEATDAGGCIGTVLIKPKIDNRSAGATVSSRTGLAAEADLLLGREDRLLTGWTKSGCGVVIVDEAQFLTAAQVEDLKIITEIANTPVYCYGLRTDFKGELFEGSKRLFELADKIYELESFCSQCGRPEAVIK